MSPRLLLLDEPTSRLDSASAFFVIQTLHCLSRDGRTVIASIHQPSCEVFELFDRLYLLSGGKTVYFGKASEANQARYTSLTRDSPSFVSKQDFLVLFFRNPLDHFLQCCNFDFDKVKASLRELIKSYTLTKRSFVNMSRDFGYYWLRVMIYSVVSVCLGTIYYNVGTKYNSIQARDACSSFVIGFMTFMSIGGFPSFVEDMKVRFSKGKDEWAVGVIVFVISNTLSAMPFLILIAVLSGTVCYFMVYFHPVFSHYLFFLLALYASITTVESLMMVIASVVPNFLMDIITGVGILGISMLVTGFFRLPYDIPKPVWRYPVLARHVQTNHVLQ
ncbi:hypothetical protein KY284_034266 [Solanum tuberosum]|nr:hypothetical protein KY284_034266 [Solanum tuberosum]